MKEWIRIVLLIGMMVPHLQGFGQSSTFIGLVEDSVSGAALVGVEVLADGKAVAFTDNTGRFRVEWRQRIAIDLRLRMTGYRELALRVARVDVIGEGPLVLRMVRSTTELDMVVIRPGPQVVYQRDDLHVGAFHVDADGLWVLVYEKPKLWHREDAAGEQVLKGARLHLLDTLFRERYVITLPGSAMALHHDHRQRPIVEGVDEAWAAEVSANGIVLTRIDKTALRDRILPWTDSIPGRLLGSDLSATYPAFQHIAYDPVDHHATAICAVEDKHLVQLFRSQYKYMSGADKVIAMNLENETGIDREVIAGYMTAFYKDLYYRVPYAPLFVVHDTLCIFDRYIGAIRRFTGDLSPAGNAPFTERIERDRWSVLLQDNTDDRVYALFRRGVHTWLRSVDQASGHFGDVIALTHPFPEEVQVSGGYVYYVYRPYGSLQHRTLYREALR